jgi:LacI family transcriptional regulator
MACQLLAKRGYRRIGLAVSSSFDLRVEHHLTAALAWHNSTHSSDAVPPYVHSGSSMEGLAAWLQTERPDVVLAHNSSDLLSAARAAGMSVPGSLALANFHQPQSRLFAGIDEKVQEIGTTAIDLLSGMVMRGDKGIPKTAKITMLEGSWIEGTSVRKGPIAARKTVAETKRRRGSKKNH